MTFEEYIKHAATYHRQNWAQRVGQAYFNYLEDVRPGIADKLRGSHVDPFFDDHNLAWFLYVVQSEWSRT